MIGSTGEKSIIVTADHTARVMGSGSLDVFATPALIALMEAAAVAALEPHLAAGQSSVGIEINVKHLAATPVGITVRAEAEIIAVEGRQITFRVKAWDSRDLIGEGTHRRAIIEIERFLKRVHEKNG